ncbi:hypothetical protein [Streptomyces sp. S1]|uniref:hypothetical protein n=1 Tax=Streptomyces sp. S1 TaxID=718288 RepID=UPI003D7127E8
MHDDGKRDRPGYGWITREEDGKLPPRMSPAPFEKVKAGTGDFGVPPWLPDHPAE